ncbi:Retaining alpha-galactosidase precursor [uncultured Bacteroides sp.]|nr:Retaining alpha-galactosidase precursor [uncultured Bacteroides sp.]
MIQFLKYHETILIIYAEYKNILDHLLNQYYDDNEAYNATLHPFIRNTIGCMEFGGTVLNKYLNKTNDGGAIRRTTDVFQIATAVLFQNPIQNFAITPNNMYDAPSSMIEFMKDVPTTWDETRFIDGYPGKYCVLARRHNNKWYIAGVNALKEPLKLKLNLSMLDNGNECTYYYDNKNRQPQKEVLKIKDTSSVNVVIQPEGGIVIVK